MYMLQSPIRVEIFSFNSLQTGNCIQTLCRQGSKMAETAQVSIPFKRETAFKHGLGCIHTESTENSSFNSLQTGNCIQTATKDMLCDHNRRRFEFQFPSNGKLHSNKRTEESSATRELSFNSLQTGNCIQTADHEQLINFWVLISFNSLQTGNCIQTIKYLSAHRGSAVSIPFKRETAFKLFSGSESA